MGFRWRSSFVFSLVVPCKLAADTRLDVARRSFRRGVVALRLAVAICDCFGSTEAETGPDSSASQLWNQSRIITWYYWGKAIKTSIDYSNSTDLFSFTKHVEDERIKRGLSKSFQI